MRLGASRQWLTPDAEATQALGAELGRRARPGDVITCCGTLGAGKTTFVQGFAKGIGVSPDAYVRSPTFTLVHEYEGRCRLYHFDFYRLSELSEVEDIGFEDYCCMGGVVIVEWADKFPSLFTPHRLDISIAILTAHRRAICVTDVSGAYAHYLGDEGEA